jgi:dTMP kinase
MHRVFRYLDEKRARHPFELTMFITFEGLDCSGKTTQAKLLVDRLQSIGKDVVFLREPGGTTISEKIRDILLDKEHFDLTQGAELFLFSAARTQLVHHVIRPAIQSGKAVVCDRFFDSTTAYQGYGRRLNLEDVRAINRLATFGTTPDLTVLVEIGTDEMFRRRIAAGLTADRMESAGREFFDRIRNGYRAIVESEPNRFVVIDGMRSVQDIHDDLWRIVQSRFKL